jgi:hypothetical protein
MKKTSSIGWKLVFSLQLTDYGYLLTVYLADAGGVVSVFLLLA